MRQLRLISAILAFSLSILAAMSCDSKAQAGDESTTKASHESTTGASDGTGLPGKGGVDGLQAMLAELARLGDAQLNTLQRLKPSSEDLALLFDKEAHAKIAAHADKSYAMIRKPFIGNQVSETVCFPATEIKTWSGPVERELPGGVKPVAPHLADEVEFCATRIGSSTYNGFMFVDGRWFFVPKFWQAFDD